MTYPTKKLSEVCNSVESVRPSDVYDEDFLYIDITSVNPKSKAVIAPRRISVNEAPGRARQLVHAGDIVFATTRPYLENIAPVTVELDGAIASTGFCVISPKREVCDSRYIFLIVSSKAFIERVLVHQKGASYPAVSDQALFNLEIPLPPVREQRKIVEKLEKQFAKIDEAARLRAESEALADQLLPAALHEIFAAAGAKGWEEKTIAEVCDHPQYGFTASASQKSVGPKFLRITDIQDGQVNWSSVPYCVCKSIEKYQLKSGDLVFARTGATVGKSFLITDVPTQAIFASYLIRLRAGKTIMPEFLYYFFQSPDYWNQISAGQTGMQPNVNGTKLAKIKIPLPPLAEQKKIVKKLGALAEKARTFRNLQSSQSVDLKALKQSILHQAFAQ